MAWKNILDMRRAVDYLCSRPEVQKDRIGCYGHSMGSTFTWLVGPWEPRLKCLVGNCCLPTYKAIHRTHILHCFPNFIPGWFQYGDTPDIAALIAPRALHLNFGETDGGSPIQEVREGVQTIARAYQRAGAADKFSYFIEAGAGHVLSDANVEAGPRLVPETPSPHDQPIENQPIDDRTIRNPSVKRRTLSSIILADLLGAYLSLLVPSPALVAEEATSAAQRKGPLPALNTSPGSTTPGKARRRPRPWST